MNKRQLKKQYKRMILEVHIQASHIEYLKAEITLLENLYNDAKSKCEKLEQDNFHLRLAYKSLEDLYQEQSKHLSKPNFIKKMSNLFKGDYHEKS